MSWPGSPKRDWCDFLVAAFTLPTARVPGSTFVIWLPERAVAGVSEGSFEQPDCDPLGRSKVEALAH